MKSSNTHTILAKLRELRDGGFDGKINPAMMRELTGIEQPGRTMYELFKGGYLVKAGKINLPAHTGLTRANQYTINPQSDLMPKPHYSVAQHRAMNEAKRVKPCHAFNAFLYGGLA